MSLWLFSEDGLTLVDVTREKAMVRAWHDNTDPARPRWLVGLPTSGVTLASFPIDLDAPEELVDEAKRKACQFLERLAGQLNASQRRPGEAPDQVAKRLQP